MVSARTDRILTSIENRVLSIQFNRADKKNALTGYHRAASLFLCGEILDARGASAMGLVKSVHPGGELPSQLEKIARLLAAKPPSALRLTKALMKSETRVVSSRMAEERMFFEA